MPERYGKELWDIARKVAFHTHGRIDFTRTDPAGRLAIVHRLTHAAFYFNIISITDYGGKTGRERGRGLVEQVVGAAFQTYAGVDPHPHPFEKAAMLLRGITQGHPFSDANKRTGFLLVTYYLKAVGYPWSEDLSVDTVLDFCLAVSAGDIRDIDAMARTLAELWSISYP